MGVLGVVGLAAGGMITARASVSDTLPDTTTANLVADLGSSSAHGFSGTVVTQVALGLPALPALPGSQDGSSMASMLSGAHTLRVWYGGPDEQRVALLSPTSESDLFHSGTNVWEWDSDTRVATHTVLPAHPADSQPAMGATVPSGLESMNPQQLASALIATLDPTTTISLGPRRTVADRSAYDLVLTPKQSGSLIGSVHIAVDGATKMPLGVQIYPRGSASAALDVAFSGISFSAPPASYFTFTPPPGATVRTGSIASWTGSATSTSGEATRVSTIGTGWSQVVEYRTSNGKIDLGQGTLPALTRVSGSWGQGRLLSSALFSVLLTDDGRIFAGAVDPATLYSAASSH